MFNRCCFIAMVGFLLGGTAIAADKPGSPVSAEDVAKGWIALFDGESTFGWKIDGEAKVEGGKLVIGGTKATTITHNSTFGSCECRLEFDDKAEYKSTPIKAILRRVNSPSVATFDYSGVTSAAFGLAGRQNQVQITVPAGKQHAIKSFTLLPTKSKSLFNGKDLTGWKVNMADPKRVASKFDVTPAGELRVINGPGDLMTESQYADFCLQYECKTNGKYLNSGIFFRCMPGQYQNGYEAQIQNAYGGTDRTKPVDFGTGAIYRRIPARKVVSNDEEWFTMTVVANGARIATWVNGYQVVDWLDDRKADENPRKGLRTAAGHFSIQGHDPTTNIVFRNFRVVDLTELK